MPVHALTGRPARHAAVRAGAPRTPVVSPVADSYARLAALGAALPGLRVSELAAGDRAPDGEGWMAVADLAAGGGALDALLDWNGAQVVKDHGRPARPDVVATFALHRYAWSACLLITVPWFLGRRVPRFPVTHVWYHPSLGRMAVRSGTFACLPGDPAAVLPDARVVADGEALRAEVRTAVAEHLAPLLAAFGPRMRRRDRALWGMATDEIAEGLWYVGRLLGAHEERRAVRELSLLLPGATAPFASGAGFGAQGATHVPDGPSPAARDRASCCLFYTLRPEDICANCPRICGTDRAARRSGHCGH